MPNRIDAIDAVKEMAMNGLSPVKIRKQLQDRGLGDLLDRYEIDALVAEMGFVKRMLPQRPSKVLPRTIGVIAILLGIWAISLGGGGRQSPRGYGMIAVILGAILVIRPDLSRGQP